MRTYIIHDMLNPNGKKVTGTELIKIAKSYLSINKKNGLDKDFKSKDLDNLQIAIFYLEERCNFRVDKGPIPKNRQWIVVDQYLHNWSSIGGVTKQEADRIARDYNRIAKDKKHRLYKIVKGKEFRVEKFNR